MKRITVLLLILYFGIVMGLTIVVASKVWTVWTVQVIQETWMRCPKVEKYKTADEGDTI